MQTQAMRRTAHPLPCVVRPSGPPAQSAASAASARTSPVQAHSAVRPATVPRSLAPRRRGASSRPARRPFVAWPARQPQRPPASSRRAASRWARQHQAPSPRWQQGVTGAWACGPAAEQVCEAPRPYGPRGASGAETRALCVRPHPTMKRVSPVPYVASRSLHVCVRHRVPWRAWTAATA